VICGGRDSRAFVAPLISHPFYPCCRIPAIPGFCTRASHQRIDIDSQGSASVYRQIIGYFPSVIVPAFVSMAMVYAYTRLLTPAAFGSYTFVFSVVLVLQTSLFFALPIAVVRFYPQAAATRQQDRFLKEAYALFYGMAGVAVVLCVGIGLLVDLPADYRLAAWLALPLLLFRSLVQLNQSVNRSGNRMARHNTVEGLHAALGFGLGLVALFVVGHGPEAIILGLLIAAIICASIDFRLLGAPFHPTAGAFRRQELHQLIDYAWPLVGAQATEIIMQNGDRFLLGSLAGTEMLGIYAVAYSLVERPTTLICLSITTATFSLVMQVLERHGKEAARIQAGRNGIALLAIALPACAGLALTADYVSAVLVGPAFRGGVAALIPIMCFAALIRGVRAHFVDHAFHLSGKPLTMLWGYVPATVLNILLNLWAVPHYGMFGAAWTSVICQIVVFSASWYLGNRQFPVWLPPAQVVRSLLAIVPMAAALILVRFPLDWLGLIAALLMGGTVYVASAIALDVGEIRSRGWDALCRRLQRNVPAPAE
jgi:O-antigen/teichoic acid export membrane protein